MIIMKKKQSLKKLIIHPSNPIKLKFDNIKIDNKDSLNATANCKDIDEIRDIERCLEDVINMKTTLRSEDAAACLDLIRKLRRMLENQLVGGNKFNFRIAKSARKPKCVKKLESEAFRQSQDDQEQKILNTSTLSSNQNNLSSTSSFYESQTYTHTQTSAYNKIKPSFSQVYRANPINKLKIGKTNPKQIQGVLIENNINASEKYTNKDCQLVVKKLNEKIQELQIKIQEKSSLEANLTQKVKQLENSINSHLLKDRQIFNIDLKFSLKEPQTKPIRSTPTKKSKFHPTTSPQLSQSRIDEYQKQLRENLQHIIISQNKVIENLYFKLSTNERPDKKQY